MSDSESFEFNLTRLPLLARVPILRKLEHSSPDDLLNLFQVFPSEHFREPTESTKSTWLFEKLFPLLLPYLSPYEDVLQCRLVCYRWKLIIDRTLANLGVDDVDLESTVDFYAVTPFCAEEKELLEKLQEMEAHPHNPFVFRTILLCKHIKRDHWVVIKRLMEQHGAHIWKLVLGGFDCGDANANPTLLLRDILRCTPNLRMLLVGKPRRYGEGRNIIPLKEEDRRSLAEFPIPKMSALQYLYDEPGYLAYDVLLPSCSPYLVEMTIPPAFFGEYDSGTHGTFPRLTALEVEVKSEAELRKLTQLESPLRLLEVNLKVRIPLRVQMDVFHHFGETIETIEMKVDENWARKERKDEGENLDLVNGKEGPWEFPHLTRICVPVMDKPRESLDWLINIRPGPKRVDIKISGFSFFSDDGLLVERYDWNTERFSWEDREGEPPPPFFANRMDREMVQLHGFLNNLDVSAVWEMLPRLETVRVDTSIVVRSFQRPTKNDAIAQ